MAESNGDARALPVYKQGAEAVRLCFSLSSDVCVARVLILLAVRVY